MSDIITLLSSDDEDQPARKKFKAESPQKSVFNGHESKTFDIKEEFENNASNGYLQEQEDGPLNELGCNNNGAEEDQSPDDSSDLLLCTNEVEYTSRENSLSAQWTESPNIDQEESSQNSECTDSPNVEQKASSECADHKESPNIEQEPHPECSSIDSPIIEYVNPSTLEPEVEAVPEERSAEEHNMPSTSAAVTVPNGDSHDIQTLFSSFLEQCKHSIKDNANYQRRLLAILPKAETAFQQCTKAHSEPTFRMMLLENIEKTKLSDKDAVVAFNEVNAYLLTELLGPSVEVSDDVYRKLKMLERTIKLILAKLKKLGAAEVDFDDEQNSTYMQEDRYAARLQKVYAKYCELLEMNPQIARKYHCHRSDHVAINRAITKSYKYNKFPSYADIERIVRRCVRKHDLSLTEGEIKRESESRFKEMGTVLQNWRKMDLYENHREFIAGGDDPAQRDAELNCKLRQSRSVGEEKMKEVIQKFVVLQDDNNQQAAVPESEDSDDSHFEDSDQSSSDNS